MARRDVQRRMAHIDRLAKFAERCSLVDREAFLAGLVVGEAQLALFDGAREDEAVERARATRAAVETLVAIRLRRSGSTQ